MAEQEECPRCGGTGKIERASITLGDRIKAQRKRAGMTQEALAREMNLSRASIANIETNRAETTISKLRQFATALGCTLEDLVP